MINRMVAAVLAGVVCAGTTSGQRGGLTTDVITPVESPISVSTRPTASEHMTPLSISYDDMDAMRSAERLLMLGVPLNAAEAVDLDLRRVPVFDPGAELVNGNDPAQSLDDLNRRSRNLILGGQVAGAAGSQAYMAITPTGVHGFIKVDGHTHVISSGNPSGPARPVIYNMTTLPEGVIEWRDFVCNAIDPDTLASLDETEITPERLELLDAAPTGAQIAQLPDGDGGVALLGDDGAVDDCRVVNVAIEIDEEFGALYGGDDPRQALLDYVESLVGAVSFIYINNVNLRFNVIFVRDWIGEPAGSDPWEGLSTADVLFELREEWTPNSAPTGLNWQGVHLFSSRNLGGGIAFLRAICNQDIAHAVSANMNGAFPSNDDGTIIPNNPLNWDIVVVAHEWGHNLGAPHTHGLEPVVDGCGLGDCGLADSGTIMSYCHLCPGGLGNIDLNFSQRIIDEGIRPYIEAFAPCNLLQPSDLCENNPPAECLPDVNDDGVLNGADFTAWILAYNAGDLRADMNGDNQLTPADFNAWLLKYREGCDFGEG